jgi:hypothetical protein
LTRWRSALRAAFGSLSPLRSDPVILSKNPFSGSKRNAKSVHIYRNPVHLQKNAELYFKLVRIANFPSHDTSDPTSIRHTMSTLAPSQSITHPPGDFIRVQVNSRLTVEKSLCNDTACA